MALSSLCLPLPRPLPLALPRPLDAATAEAVGLRFLLPKHYRSWPYKYVLLPVQR